MRFGGVDSPGHLRVPDSKTLKFGEVMSVSFWVRVEDDASATWMDGSGKKVPLAGQVVVAKSGDRTGFVIKRGEEGEGLRGLDVTAQCAQRSCGGGVLEGGDRAARMDSCRGDRGEGRDADLPGRRIDGTGQAPGESGGGEWGGHVCGDTGGEGVESVVVGAAERGGGRLRIYNRELTAEEVKELAKRG